MHFDFNLEENDNGKIRHHQFRWVDLDTLDALNVRSSDLKKVLKYNLEGEHIIHIER